MSRIVFVGNIPFEMSEEQLVDIFKEVGPVHSFKLMFDRETGKPRGFGFCEYADVETANSAIRNLNGFDIGGRTLKVGYADHDMPGSKSGQTNQANRAPPPPPPQPPMQMQIPPHQMPGFPQHAMMPPPHSHLHFPPPHMMLRPGQILSPTQHHPHVNPMMMPPPPPSMFPQPPLPPTMQPPLMMMPPPAHLAGFKPPPAHLPPMATTATLGGLPPSVEAVNNILASMSNAQLVELVKQLKNMAVASPEQAKIFLNANPALAYALLQALLATNLVDASTAQQLVASIPSPQTAAPPTSTAPVTGSETSMGRTVDGKLPADDSKPAPIEKPPTSNPPSPAAPLLLDKERQQALIAQIISMTPEQIDLLPPEQRDQILMIRAQIQQQQQR